MSDRVSEQELIADDVLYQRIIDAYRRGMITLDEMRWEMFRASAKHFSPALPAF